MDNLNKMQNQLVKNGLAKGFDLEKAQDMAKDVLKEMMDKIKNIQDGIKDID